MMKKEQLVRLKGFYFGEYFNITVNVKCYLKIIETFGVRVYSEEYL